jgi:hypothetical protein
MKRITIAATSTALLLVGLAGPAAAGPTCSGVLPVEVHGQHIIGDYVTGVGMTNLDWPPAGQVGGGGGVAIKGGPGPGFHFQLGLAPGASFCTDRAPFTVPEPHQP